MKSRAARAARGSQPVDGGAGRAPAGPRRAARRGVRPAARRRRRGVRCRRRPRAAGRRGPRGRRYAPAARVASTEASPSSKLRAESSTSPSVKRTRTSPRSRSTRAGCVLLPRDDAERGPDRCVHQSTLPAAVRARGGGCPARTTAGLRRAQVDRHDGAGREHPGVEVEHEPVGAGHHRGRLVTLGRVGAQGVAQLAHHRGGLHGVALHVADDEGDPLARQLQHVVPVTADAHAVGRGQVAGGGGQPLRSRQRAGQQLLLQLGGQGALGSRSRARARVCASRPLTLTSSERSSGGKSRGWSKLTVRLPSARPETVSGRKAQACLRGRLDQLRAARVLAVVRSPGRQEQRVAGPQHLGDRAGRRRGSARRAARPPGASSRSGRTA